MKSSPQQLFREAESLKSMLNIQEAPMSKESWLKRRKIGQLLELILLTDLDYALDKKVEQDLWNIVYRNPITALQSKSKDAKNSSQTQQSQLAMTLEAASGFYLQLLQKLASINDIDLLFHPRDSTFGLSPEWKSISKANKSSVMYICQHCMVHLGDIARYRGQSLQAETFYRHAIDLIPSNGQPYNQLAILEAASGEKLSTVFFYVRSLAVQHPFPLAATNLNKLYYKMSTDGGSFDSKSRMSAYEYISAFLQFHSIVHLGTDFHKAEKVLCQLTTSLPALIIAEKLETWQLIQMVTISMFTLGHAWNSFGDTNKNDAEILIVKKSELSSDESQTVALTLDLMVSMINTFLLPIHAILDLKETQDYFTIPAVKVILDWIVYHHKTNGILREEAFAKRPQIWNGLCKLSNNLDPEEGFDKLEVDFLPLPEDWDLQCFLPLQNAHKNLQFQNQENLSEEQICRLRASRLKFLVSELAQFDVAGKSLISVSISDGRPARFNATQAPVLSDQVLLQQIKEQLAGTNLGDESLAAEPNAVINSHESSKSVLSEPPQLVQEVRFKLDGHESKDQRLFPEDASLIEGGGKRHLEFRSPPPLSTSIPTPHPLSSSSGIDGVPMNRKTVRQNVALQAIMQQRALNYASGGRVLEQPPKASNGDLKEQSWMNMPYNPQISSGVPNCRTDVPPPPPRFLNPPLNPPGLQSVPKSLEMSYKPPQHPHLSQAMFGMMQQQPQQQPPTPHMGLPPQTTQGNAMSSYMPNNSRMMWNYNLPPSSPYSGGASTKMGGMPPPHPLMQPPPQPQHPMFQAEPLSSQKQKCPPPPNSGSGGVGPPASFMVMPPPPSGPPPNSQDSLMAAAGHRDTLMQSILGNPTPNSMSNYHQMALQQQQRNRDQADNAGASYRYGMNPGNLQQQSLDEAQRNHFHLPYASVGPAVATGGSQNHHSMNNSGINNSGTESGVNTYSLFNSPWSSGLTSSRKEGASQGMGSTGNNMQHRTQSLWSGPGPSPLERLLEQQKQRRDASNP